MGNALVSVLSVWAALVGGKLTLLNRFAANMVSLLAMVRFFGAATSFRSDQVFGVHEMESTRERDG